LGWLNYSSAFRAELDHLYISIYTYWIIGKGVKENFRIKSGFSAAGVISFVVGAIFACITGGTFANFPGLVAAMPFLNLPFFVGPVNGIVVSLLLYVILSKVIEPKEK